MANADTIKQISETIVRAINPEKIILFGSHAKGRQTQDSDIDLLVVWKTDLAPHQRNMAVRRLFPGRSFALDVFVYTPEEERRLARMNGSFFRMAADEGVLIHGR